MTYKTKLVLSLKGFISSDFIVSFIFGSNYYNLFHDFIFSEGPIEMKVVVVYWSLNVFENCEERFVNLCRTDFKTLKVFI